MSIFFAFILGVFIGGFIGMGLSIPLVQDYLEDKKFRESKYKEEEDEKS